MLQQPIETSFHSPIQSITPIEFQKKAEAVIFIAKAMKDKYVFHEKGAEVARHLQSRLQEGAYDTIKDPKTFATTLTNELYAITQDIHLEVSQVNPPLEKVDAADDFIPIDEFKDFHPDLINIKTFVAPTNVGWMGKSSLHYEYQSGFLKDNPDIGYFVMGMFGLCNDQKNHLRRFEIAESLAISEDVKARRVALIEGIQHLKGAKSIIIDFRPNIGGDPAAVQFLCSLFMEEKLLLNRLEWRDSEAFQSDLFETLPKEELPYTLRLIDMPLYILAGQNTYSAAEAFMSDMKVHKRATLVGATTGGGANPGAFYQINNLFNIFIPLGRAVNPFHETNWEGVGILPDCSTKEDHALRAALELIQVSKDIN